MQRGEERLSNARAQRNRLLAAFEGINAAEDDMEAVIARSLFTYSLSFSACLVWLVLKCTLLQMTTMYKAPYLFTYLAAVVYLLSSSVDTLSLGSPV